MFASALPVLQQPLSLPLWPVSVWDLLAVGVCLTTVAHSQGCQQCQGLEPPLWLSWEAVSLAVQNEAGPRSLMALWNLGVPVRGVLRWKGEGAC